MPPEPEPAVRPRVLLVYASPAITASPVPPYGMECVGHAFRVAGCDVALLTPYLESDPVVATREAISALQPDLVGVSVRNIDDALVVRGPAGEGDIDTAFYLDEVRVLVASIIAMVGRNKVIAGGPALSAGTYEIAAYLGLRWAIGGPAEDLCWRMGRALVQSGSAAIGADPRIVDVDEGPKPRINLRDSADAKARREAVESWRPVPGPTPRMGESVRLAVARQGRIPVTVSVGCDRRCIFCVEAAYTGWSVQNRDPAHVVAEVGLLAKAGVRRFWLACSEANVSGTGHTKAVLAALVNAGLAKPGGPLDFAVFVQPAPIDDDFLDALEAAGIDPTSLSFEFGHLEASILLDGGGPANRSQIDRLVNLWLKRGFRQLGGSVLLGAHPRETMQTLSDAVASARQIDAAFPEGFGLAYACGARVYPGSPLSDRIRHLGATNLYCRAGDTIDPQFVRPVVFATPLSPRALAAHLHEAFRGTRGKMQPMNAEAVVTPDKLRAEQAVNRGIVRVGQGRHLEAEAAFETALAADASHAEALAQAAQLAANHLGNPTRARAYLQRLLAGLPEGDGRISEVSRALRAIPG